MSKTSLINQLLLELKQKFSQLYQEDLEDFILFGSQAREDATEFSDIDLLTILRTDINPYQEIDKTGDIIAQYSLENDVVISCHFISSAKFHQQDTPFLANVKREGILL
ncbi:MAG: nucleotidyltransferase domain-containing protein [Limnothrix sp.]